MNRKKHRTSPYAAEFRERAVQMVVDHLDGYRSLTGGVRHRREIGLLPRQSAGLVQAVPA